MENFRDLAPDLGKAVRQFVLNAKEQEEEKPITSAAFDDIRIIMPARDIKIIETSIAPSAVSCAISKLFRIPKEPCVCIKDAREEAKDTLKLKILNLDFSHINQGNMTIFLNGVGFSVHCGSMDEFKDAANGKNLTPAGGKRRRQTSGVEMKSVGMTLPKDLHAKVDKVAAARGESIGLYIYELLAHVHDYDPETSKKVAKKRGPKRMPRPFEKIG